MFSSGHPTEKGNGREEVECPQLQTQHSRPREDVPVNTYDYAIADATVPRTVHDSQELISYVQSLNLSTPDDICSFDSYCSKTSQSKTNTLSHGPRFITDDTAHLASRDGAIRAPATDLKKSFKSEVPQSSRPKNAASVNYIDGSSESTREKRSSSFPVLSSLAKDESSSDDEANYEHCKKIHGTAAKDESISAVSNSKSLGQHALVPAHHGPLSLPLRLKVLESSLEDDELRRAPTSDTCVHKKNAAEGSIEDACSNRLDVEDSGRDDRVADFSKYYNARTSPDLKILPSEDWAERNSYLGGIGSWTREPSPSPSNLLVKQTSGKNQNSPLIDVTGPTTFNQHGSHQGSGSNQNPTYSFQDINTTGSGNQYPNGRQNGSKRLPTDNEDGEDNGPAKFGTPEADREAWLSQGKIFACQFNKYDPAYYRTSLQNGETYIKCAAGLGWNISGLKEHLYRVHEAPLRCFVCGLVFPNGQEDTLATHNSTCCDVQFLLPLRGMTPDMKIRIRDRHKHRQNPTEEQKWFDIYRILFPDAVLPSSPYRDEFYNMPSVSPGSDMTTWLTPMNLGIQTASTALANITHHRHMSSGQSSTDSGYFSHPSTPRCGNADCACCMFWVERATPIAQNSHVSPIPAELPFQIQQESSIDPSKLQRQSNTFNLRGTAEQFPMDQPQDDESWDPYLGSILEENM